MPGYGGRTSTVLYNVQLALYAKLRWHSAHCIACTSTSRSVTTRLEMARLEMMRLEMARSEMTRLPFSTATYGSRDSVNFPEITMGYRIWPVHA